MAALWLWVCLLLASALFSHAMPSDLFSTTVIDVVDSYSKSATCSAGGVTGVCVNSATSCSGASTNNLCPNAADKCCTNNKCIAPSGSGTCMQSSLCSSNGGVSHTGYCTGPSDLQCCVMKNPSLQISRDEIIARAQDWVNRQIPYSQTSTTDGYRQDCSGYTSMSWKTSKPGYTTSTISNICSKIAKSDLKAGDAILKTSSHVLLFHKWVDSDSFMAYAEREPGTVATYYKTSYNYYSSNGYFPCRYNSVS